MNRNLLIGLLIGVLIIGAVIVAARTRNPAVQTGDETEQGDQSLQVPTPPASSVDETIIASPSGQEEGAIKTFNIQGSNYVFSVSTIRVQRGDTVRINFSSTQGMHDWKVDEFNAATNQVNQGQSDTVEFIADESGTFEYYCSVGDHRQRGMVGSLIVED